MDFFCPKRTVPIGHIEQKEVFDAMERAGDNLVAAVEKAKKDAEMMK